VISEALRGGMNPAVSTSRTLASDPTDDRRTIIHFQEFGGLRYLDRGCFVEKVTSCPY
jgi:hypothetical protein